MFLPQRNKPMSMRAFNLLHTKLLCLFRYKKSRSAE